MSTAELSREIRGGRRRIRVRSILHTAIDVRTLVTIVGLVLAMLVVGFISLMLGDTMLGPGDVWDALTGRAMQSINFVVIELRVPRVLACMLIGGMLGASGAIFQTITRNPLGSPDILGFSTGAHLGGTAAIVVFGTTMVSAAGGALVGGTLTAVVILLLSSRGGAKGGRLILTGIAVTAMLSAANLWLILRADLTIAQIAAAWGAGSMVGQNSDTVRLLVITAVVLGVACVFLARPLAQLDLGDERAASTGARPRLVRVLAIAIGVAFVAITTAVAGPIAFVALSAPQIARRIARAPGTPMAPAAAAGALIVTAADLAGQNLIPGMQFQVGIVTVIFGGLYLVWLLCFAKGKK